MAGFFFMRLLSGIYLSASAKDKKTSSRSRKASPEGRVANPEDCTTPTAGCESQKYTLSWALLRVCRPSFALLFLAKHKPGPIIEAPLLNKLSFFGLKKCFGVLRFHFRHQFIHHGCDASNFHCFAFGIIY